MNQPEIHEPTSSATFYDLTFLASREALAAADEALARVAANKSTGYYREEEKEEEGVEAELKHYALTRLDETETEPSCDGDDDDDDDEEKEAEEVHAEAALIVEAKEAKEAKEACLIVNEDESEETQEKRANEESRMITILQDEANWKTKAAESSDNDQDVDDNKFGFDALGKPLWVWYKVKVAYLKAELLSRGLKVTGKKLTLLLYYKNPMELLHQSTTILQHLQWTTLILTLMSFRKQS